MIRRFESLLIPLATYVFAARVLAATPNPISEAAVKEGKHNYNAGDYAAAIHAFKRAYSVQSDNEVLYQLGKAYAMGDWPVESIEAFERYLSAAGPSLPSKRRLEIVEAIEGQQRRVGSLIFEITPRDAKVVLDETILERPLRAKPLPVRQGGHVVAVSLDGYHAQTQSIQVHGRKTETVKIALAAVEPPVYDGLLGIRCQLPSVSVLLDDRQVALTPVAEPLLIPEGHHRLRLERAGYQAQAAAVHITRAKTTEIECDLRLSQPLESSGRLELEFPETGALVLIDGTPAAKSNLLPPGPHSVEIRHYGFESWTHELHVNAGGANRVNVVLTPTPAYQQDIEQRAQYRRTWSYVLGATGIAVVGTALGIGLWNDGRFGDWKQKRSALEDAYQASGPGTPTAAELESRRNDANSQLHSIHAVDIVTAILGATGAMLLGSSTVLYFTTESPRRQRGTGFAVRNASQGVGMNVAW